MLKARFNTVATENFDVCVTCARTSVLLCFVLSAS